MGMRIITFSVHNANNTPSIVFRLLIAIYLQQA